MTVFAGRGSHPSARALRSRLGLAGYDGVDINWGYVEQRSRSRRFNDRAGRRNKRLALLRMQEQGVPIPRVYTDVEEIENYPVVGRPDKHRAGRHFYLCRNYFDARYSLGRGATHWLEFIEDGREFRVHIAFGKSIKIAEKVGGTGNVKNTENGWYFAYPQLFSHKITLREVAKKAVTSLELDFGAVDVIYKDRRFYVLEVNSAPCLTTQSDTLERYVKAFLEQC